jgi:hypothetical protein
MKKQMSVFLIILLLTLALAIPAFASKPTAVSGTREFHVPPENKTWRSAGKNCIAEFDGTYTYHDTGDLDGISIGHFKVVSHGPCGPKGPVPYKYHETIHVRGTFRGKVLGIPGSFDFSETPKNWPEDSDKAGYTSHLVILSGAGDLANLHGMLDVVGSDYTGRIHFDP